MADCGSCLLSRGMQRSAFQRRSFVARGIMSRETTERGCAKGKAAVLRRAIRPLFEKLELRQMLAGVQINEVLADNSNGITDQDGDHSDWIELRNTDATSANITGWSLTDDPALLGKWHFPSTTIPAGGYLLVWASTKNRATSGQQLHTNFSLDAGGESLLLV